MRLLVVALLTTASCVDDAMGPAAPAILSLVLAAAPAPLVHTVDVRLDEPGRVQATYWTGSDQPLRVVTEAAAERHTLLLSRLRADRDYTVEFQTLDDRGRPSAVRREQFRTDPLPADLAAIRFQAAGVPTHPLTVIEITRSSGFVGLVVVDAAGNVVWFHRTRGGVSGTTRLRNATFAVIDEGRGLLHISPDGRVIAEVAQDSASRRIHHDVIETAAGTLLFLAQDWKPAREGVVAGEAIWEWQPETGALQKRWSVWDHLDPLLDWGQQSHPTDWLHANSLALGPRGNLVMSLHFLNQVLSIAPGYGALEWRVGGVRASMTIAETERFSGQHTAAEIASNRLLLFDNGFERVTERYSRAVEFALDPANGSATRVWEWRPNPNQWARIVSLVRRLPSGNTFVAFGTSAGFVGSTGPVGAYEVTPAGAVTWHVIIDGVALMYRAWPIASLSAETSIAEPGTL